MDEATRIAEREQMSYHGFLAELLLAECDDRDRRSTIRRVSAAGSRGTCQPSRISCKRSNAPVSGREGSLLTAQRILVGTEC